MYHYLEVCTTFCKLEIHYVCLTLIQDKTNRRANLDQPIGREYSLGGSPRR